MRFYTIAWRKALRLFTPHDGLMLVLGSVITLGCFGFASYVQTLHKPLAAESATISASWIPHGVKRWQSTISIMARRYDVDPSLVAIIMTIESGGYSRANSGLAQGLMQITP